MLLYRQFFGFLQLIRRWREAAKALGAAPGGMENGVVTLGGPLEPAEPDVGGQISG
jgi:hypothetical protein